MVTFAIRVLEGLFVVGILGCIPVLLMTAVEDLRTLFNSDEAKK